MHGNDVNRDFQRTASRLLVDQLWKRSAPWQIPRRPGDHYLPYNGKTGLGFHGINAVWLMAVSEAKGYTDPRWVTEKQGNSVGAEVRPGEEGTPIEFWKWVRVQTRVDEHGQPRMERVRLQQPQLFHAVLYNSAQFDGLPAAKERVIASEQQRHTRAEGILQASGANIEHWLGAGAFYDAVRDRIRIPERSQFESENSYLGAALHELGHWTGHRSRLNRDLAHPFGSREHGKEELRCEIASLMIGQELGIGHDPARHASYTAGWIRVLEVEPLEVFRAATDASRIVQFLLDLERSHVHGTEVQTGATRAETGARVQESAPILVRGAAERKVSGTALAVPYAERGEATRLGARWDREARCWHAPEGTNLEPLRRWMLENQAIRVELPEKGRDPRDEFAAALNRLGLQVEATPMMDGMRRHVKVLGDGPGERSGTYIGYLEGHPCGWIENRRLALRVDWKSGVRVEGLRELDRARLNSEAAKRQEEREKARNSAWERTAGELIGRWSLAKPVEGQNHPYLVARNVVSFGLREDAQGNLLVPLRDAAGKLWSLQSIGRDGKQDIAEGSVTAGKFYAIGPPGTRIMLVAADYASASTLAQASRKTAVVAFGAGNLEAVARALRQAYPNRTIMIAAESDSIEGRQKAKEAACAVGGHLLVPRFDKSNGSSWNDLANKAGLEAVREQLETGFARAERQALAACQGAEAPPQHGRSALRAPTAAQAAL